MKAIRASSLPRILTCPASLKQPGVWSEPRREEAAMGTAAYAVLDVIVKHSMDTDPDLCFIWYGSLPSHDRVIF